MDSADATHVFKEAVYIINTYTQTNMITYKDKYS